MNRYTIFRAALLVAAAFVVFIIALNLMPDRRDLREPVPHVHSVADPAFVRSMGSIFGGDVRGGHQIETLINGDAIFESMLEAIAGAQDTINFETYIYWSGSIAQRFAHSLADKAREGVEVRVLVDWVGSIPFDQEIVDIMESGGVEFHRFRPLHWYTLDRVNNRTHRKLLVVDSAIGFTGGVGIGDQWLGDARNPDEWRDTHFRITGPAVSELQAAFSENWLEATGEVLQGERFYPEQPREGEIAAQLVKSSPMGGSRSMHQMLLMAMASATSHLRIGMAYLVPDDIALAQLVDARRRGVEVDILVPGEHMAVEIVRRSSRHFWGSLLEAGVRIHEYEPTMYHAKVLIADEHWVTIGSANLDERSFRHNDEANLLIYDDVFARTQIDLFNADLANARQISLEEWRNRPWHEKAMEWVASLARSQL